MATRVLSAALVFVPLYPNLSSSSSKAKSLLLTPNKIYTSLRRVSGPCNGASIAKGSVKCQASGESSDTSVDPNTVAVYQGIYGPWTVDPNDIREVISYRSGLVTAATSFVIAASTAFLPDDSPLSGLIKQNLDFFYVLGAGGLGLSLLLIHIYVTEIKRTLQALWALGIFGSLATYFSLAQPAGENLVQYVIDNPTAVWFVGPLFAALTGLVFKEGLCYGKLEAGILTFIIPSVLLGHLTGIMDDAVKVTLLGVWMALFVIFAGRKFSQPIKDDIGDKSVFTFKDLPEDQKKALVEKLEQQNSIFPSVRYKNGHHIHESWGYYFLQSSKGQSKGIAQNGVREYHTEADVEEVVLKAQAVKEVQYPTWLANTVVVKKKYGKWQVCVD